MLAQAAALAVRTTATSGTQVRKGMDLLRVGNLGDSGVAFFYDRKSMPPPPMLVDWLTGQVVPALAEVCAVFSYDHRYVTLFHQPGSASRFVRQRVLLNTEPIFERLQGTLLLKGVSDVRSDPEGWCYCYLYGLLIHKLGHYNDIVHGTRHDFYMNELRIEYLEKWIGLLERHGLDPAAIETSGLTRRMVKQLAPGETVN